MTNERVVVSQQGGSPIGQFVGEHPWLDVGPESSVDLFCLQRVGAAALCAQTPASESDAGSGSGGLRTWTDASGTRRSRRR